MADQKPQTKGIFGSLEQAIADSIITPEGGVVKAVQEGMTREALARKKREEELLAAQAAKQAQATAVPEGSGNNMFTDGVYDPAKASISQKIFHALFGG